MPVADIQGYAGRIGLDLPRFTADLGSATVVSQVDVEEANAQSVKVDATPAFFFNGRPLYGARPAADYQKVLAEELAHADAVLAAGVASADLYNTITRQSPTEVPATVEIARGGPRVAAAWRKCAGGRRPTTLKGITISPMNGTWVAEGKTTPPERSPEDARVLDCLMTDLKEVTGRWKL
jgi:hypothetical protein